MWLTALAPTLVHRLIYASLPCSSTWARWLFLFFLNFFICMFWLHGVLVTAHGLSLVAVYVCESCSVVSSSLRPHGLHSPWRSPGQNTGVGNLSLLQRIFLTQGLNPGLLHYRQILYQLSHQGSPWLFLKCEVSQFPPLRLSYSPYLKYLPLLSACWNTTQPPVSSSNAISSMLLLHIRGIQG